MFHFRLNCYFCLTSRIRKYPDTFDFKLLLNMTNLDKYFANFYENSGMLRTCLSSYFSMKSQVKSEDEQKVKLRKLY